MTAATKTKTGRVVFTGTATNLRIVLRTEIPPQFNQSGMQIQQKIPEVVAEFRGGQFVADNKTASKLGFESVDELVSALRGHPAHRDNPDTPHGEFFEVPNDVAAPDPTEDLRTLGLLAASQDVESLEKAIREEREGWGREVVIRAAEDFLVLLREGTDGVREGE